MSERQGSSDNYGRLLRFIILIIDYRGSLLGSDLSSQYTLLFNNCIDLASKRFDKLNLSLLVVKLPLNSLDQVLSVVQLFFHLSLRS